MRFQLSLFFSSLAVVFCHPAAAQSLNLEQHFEQNTVWHLTSGGGPGIDCPEYIQLGDRGARQDDNEDYRPGDVFLGFKTLEPTEGNQRDWRFANNDVWRYRPNMTRGRATLEDRRMTYIGVFNSSFTQSVRGDVVSLEFLESAFSIIGGYRNSKVLSYDRRTGVIMFTSSGRDAGSRSCRYEITALPQAPVAADDSARGDAPDKPVAEEAGQPGATSAQQE